MAHRVLGVLYVGRPILLKTSKAMSRWIWTLERLSLLCFFIVHPSFGKKAEKFGAPNENRTLNHLAPKRIHWN